MTSYREQNEVMEKSIAAQGCSSMRDITPPTVGENIDNQIAHHVKAISRLEATRAAYNVFRGWTLPADENGDDEGYLVEYLDGGKPNTTTHAGYVSWSPKEQFDAAYRPCDAMTFGLAIEALKRGSKVARSGWNGKGMWLVLVPGTPNAQLREGTPYAVALGESTCEILPHIDMWTTNASGRRAMLPGWLASQTDMLAEDWQIVL